MIFKEEDIKYQGVATLGVNLNRQKYGPLDVSSVLLTEDDLAWYILGSAENAPTGWTGGTPYPYPGQIIVTLDTNVVHQLYLDGEVLKTRPMIDLPEFYSKEEINQMMQNVTVDLTGYYTKEEVDNLLNSIDIPEVDLSNYYTKAQIDDIVSSIEGTEDMDVMIAMSEEEILAIVGSTEGGVPVTPSGQVLREMSAEDVQNIING